MKGMMKLLAMVAVAGLVSVAMAKEQPDKPAKHEGADAKAVHGQVLRVEGDTVVLQVGRGKQKAELPVVTNKDTKVTIDGVAKTVADLKAGLYAKVSPATGVAATIEAKAPKAKGEGKGKGKGKDDQGGAAAPPAEPKP